MDFVSDGLANGRRLKCLTVADDFSHEAVDITVDYGISRQYVTRLFDPDESLIRQAGQSSACCTDSSIQAPGGARSARLLSSRRRSSDRGQQRLADRIVDLLHPHELELPAHIRWNVLEITLVARR
jgi:hypothetical protein